MIENYKDQRDQLINAVGDAAVTVGLSNGTCISGPLALMFIEDMQNEIIRLQKELDDANL